MKEYATQNTYTQVFILALFVIVKPGNNRNVYQLVNG